MALYGYKKKTRPAPWTKSKILNSEKPAIKRFVRRTPIKRRPAWKSRLKRKLERLNPIAGRSRKLKSQYRIEARAFVRDLQARGVMCPVWCAIAELRNAKRYGHPVSGRITQVHHRYGRLGALLLWKPGWLGVSTMGHRWVHANIEEARKHGFIAQRGDWNNADVMLRPSV